jgi:hypothetical protein
MKKYLAAAGVLAAGIGVNSVATATAATSTTTKGKLVAFKYDTATKVGKLTVARAGRKIVYRVNGQSNCGYSTGQSGNQIRCKTLGKAKYANKPVRVTYHRAADGARIAELVAVDLS